MTDSSSSVSERSKISAKLDSLLDHHCDTLHMLYILVVGFLVKSLEQQQQASGLLGPQPPHDACAECYKQAHQSC